MSVHYNMTLAEAQRKAGSNGDFANPRILCGNGSYHAATTHNYMYITCPECLRIYESKPGYLGVRRP